MINEFRDSDMRTSSGIIRSSVLIPDIIKQCPFLAVNVSMLRLQEDSSIQQKLKDLLPQKEYRTAFPLWAKIAEGKLLHRMPHSHVHKII
jgi:hypothetical protein